uniref:Uncharacterized protein n=1 Tax=Arundo donax TaxID=35708 RepID=A0A0A9FMU2_ARUDO
MQRLLQFLFGFEFVNVFCNSLVGPVFTNDFFVCCFNFVLVPYEISCFLSLHCFAVLGLLKPKWKFFFPTSDSYEPFFKASLSLSLSYSPKLAKISGGS